ncbi:hypothetical protein PYCC9005_005274 [Savitreella phatthalungensis]
MSMRNSLTTILLAGLAAAQQTVYVTSTTYNCACSSTLSLQTGPAATSPTTSTVVGGATAVVAAVGSASTASSGPVSNPVAVAPNPIAAPVISSSSLTAASSSTVKPVAGVNAVSSPALAACPATAQKTYNGSPNYPRLITTVNSNTPNAVHGTDYFVYVGGGNSTLLTYYFDGSGTTCTLQYQFPTKQQIQQLKGTTDYTLSGSGAVGLYQLYAVANATQSFANKPARYPTAYEFVLTPGLNQTIATFPCGAKGSSVTYELVARGDTVYSAFYDWNPPPNALVMLTC